MEKAVKVIGSVAVALLMFAPPVCFTLSMVCGWHGFIKALCFVTFAFQFSAIASWIYTEI